MSEIIRLEDRFYILATSPLADDRTRVLKHGETFAVFDRYGDVQPVGLGEQGVYHEGTRHLSGLILRVGADRALLLSSTVKEDNVVLTVDLTNPDLRSGDRVTVPRGSVHLLRTKFLWEAACYERLQLTNYSMVPVQLSFSFELAADFADLFEVRGTRRERRGRPLPPRTTPDGLVLGYEGRDGVERWTRARCVPPPTLVEQSRMVFDVTLQPRREATFHLTLSCESDRSAEPRPSYESAEASATRALAAARDGACRIHTSNELFDEWLARSSADLLMMVTDTPHGPYPFAGVPWFSTIFGRDGILTALQYLWVDSRLARGVLAYLAAHQAREAVPEQDAQPGKILHETRKGEMAALGEIPFGCYYGSVDSTPLFVLLAEAYYRATGDRPFVESIWPAIQRAVAWCRDLGDEDQDGFVEYSRRSKEGLVNQGWKDSHDAISHADGSLAEAPVALCEVQGYVFAAYEAAAGLSEAPGFDGADDLRQRARRLAELFERTFWSEELSTYALALDGRKQPCLVRSSNPGHCLFSGIVRPDRAARVATGLLAEDMASGWGIRTLSADARRYDPMSYHNGSVWPHDNAICAIGLARYGLKHAVADLLGGLFEASLFMDLHRLPELFCGFPRRHGEGPTLYPVACAPQAWAAAAAFGLLQASLGLTIDALRSRVRFTHPRLPAFLNTLHIENLRVADSSIDLTLRRHREDVGINVDRRENGIEVLIVK